MAFALFVLGSRHAGGGTVFNVAALAVPRLDHIAHGLTDHAGSR